jgi:quinol monooxygenase YgiN
MFGTIARYQVKPGHSDELMKEMSNVEDDPPEGWLYHTVFRSTKDPNEIWLSVVFENEDVYRKSANSPEMDRQYRMMLEHLEGEPEWHDGHVIQEAMRKDPAKKS